MLNHPAFTAHAAYTLWRLDPNPTPGKKPLKVPVHYDGVTHHSLGNPKRGTPPNPAPALTAALAESWLDHNRLLDLGHDRPGEVGYLGIGFRPAGTGLACLDMDDCITPAGTWSEPALEAMRRFPGAMLELSQSGKGLHIWFTYTGPSPGRLGRDASGTYELYSEGQFIAAGRTLQGDPSTDHTEAMRAMVAQYWPPRPTGARAVTANDWDDKTPEQREATKAQLLSACRLLPQDSYGEWVEIGMALASLGDEEGLPLWHEVSSWWDGYDAEEAEAKWYQLNPDHTDYRALFAKAQRLGWVNPASTGARIDAAMAGFGEGVVGSTPNRPPPETPGTQAAPWDSATNTIANTPPGGRPGSSLTFQAAAEGFITASLPNVVDALNSNESSIQLRYDEFLGRPVIGDGQRWRPVDDADQALLRCEFERRGFKPIPAEIMKSAITVATRDNRFDSGIEWGNTLRWDGQPRVELALHRYYRTADAPYTRACSLYLFTALAGRLMDPGCQADMALILSGLQGARKTSAISALAPLPETFATLSLGTRDEDTSRLLRGTLVGELGEMRGRGQRDTESIREWITRRTEVWVEKYDRYTTRFPRRCVFVASINGTEALDDPEGERRWLPMVVGDVDVEGLQHDVQQLWAEGVHLWRQGGIQWREAERLARAEHGAFKVVDELDQAVQDWLHACPQALPHGETETGRPRGDDPFTMLQLCKGLGFTLDRVDDKLQRRLAKILKSYNYITSTQRVDGKVMRRWRRA